mgnify:CR=1 FL=1
MIQIKYIGRQYVKCEMCSRVSNQTYFYNAASFRKGFPEAKELFPDMNICEGCAQRESGKKQWSKIKRSK